MSMNKERPLISIVTVTYNCKNILERTILSILQQEYPYIEYIIIDGGSTDGTIDIINKYKNQISYFISEKDNGIFDAMNKGIKVASGKWINFMNAGDRFLNQEVLKFIFSETKNNTCDVIYGDKVLLLDDHKFYGIKAQPFYKNKSIGMGINHQCIFTKTTLVKSHPFNLSYRISADYEMIYYLYTNHAQFRYLNIPIAIVEREGFSTRNKRKQMREEERILGLLPRPSYIYWKEKLINDTKKLIFNLFPISIKRIIYSRNKNIYLIQQ